MERKTEEDEKTLDIFKGERTMNQPLEKWDPTETLYRSYLASATEQ